MSRFEDDRGVIQDWFGDTAPYGPVDSVTHISTAKGAVRGNHVHKQTWQWTLVISGRLLMASGDQRELLEQGDIVEHAPGVPHAWRAELDTECVVFTRGPRSGENYEQDTFRCHPPLL